MDVYRKALLDFRAAGECLREPMEHVEIPYEGTTLPAIVVHAENPRSERPPVVVFYTGFDGNKEMNWFMGARDIARRGMTCVSVDTPGVGESLRFRDLFLRHDYEVAGTAVLDYLATRDDVDADRAAIVAMSLGGYYASRTASMEQRFSACVAWSAQWDYHEVWRRRIEASYEMQLPVPGEHLMWSTNTSTTEDGLASIEGFRLAGVVERMRAPFLVVHGADDQQIDVQDARRLYEASGSSDKVLKIFDDDEGGTQHCGVDNLSVVSPFIFDWVAKKLGA